MSRGVAANSRFWAHPALWQRGRRSVGSVRSGKGRIQTAPEAKEALDIFRRKALDSQPLEANAKRTFDTAHTRRPATEDKPICAAAGVLHQGISDAPSGCQVGDLVQPVAKQQTTARGQCLCQRAAGMASKGD